MQPGTRVFWRPGQRLGLRSCSHPAPASTVCAWACARGRGGGYSQRAQRSLRATSMALLRSQPLLARNTSLRELEHCQAVKTTSELELSAFELSAAGVGGASVGEMVVKLGRFKPVEGSGLEDSGVGVALPSGLLVGSGAVLGSGVLLGVGLGVLSGLWVAWVVVTTTAPGWLCWEAWWA